MARLALPTLLALSGALLADIVHLNSGGKIEGIVEDAGASYRVTTTAGVTNIPKDKVAGVERADCILTVYAREAAKVAANDVDGHWRLAQMCLDAKWTSKGYEEARKVIALHPDHEAARALLGFVLHEGTWMTKKERHEALGHVQYKGKWYRPDAARRLQARDERRAFLRKAEDDLNLALAHIADENYKVRRRGHKEFIEVGHRLGMEDAESKADKLLARYDEGWARYVAQDSTIGTLEIRATDASLQGFDTFDINLGSPSDTVADPVVTIEMPRVKVHQVRTTVQCPLALKVRLADPLLDQPDNEEVLGD